MARVVVVTGAGSGIGRAVAAAFAREGDAVVLVGRRREALEATAAGARGETLVVPTDVSDGAAVTALFDAVRARFGRVDVLFNNAGTGAPPVPIDAITDAQWRAVVDVNLTGAFFCAREAIRLMKTQTPRGGRIINNGSISAHSPRPDSAPYTATKHAMTGLTKSIALDGRAFDIACGQIDIGNAATEMTERLAIGAPQASGTTMPEPRMDVEHVANAVRLMASLPLDENIPFLTIMATKMPFHGRG